MSEPIKPGDMVMVVHVHCEGSSKTAGIIYTVERVDAPERAACSVCHAELPLQAAAWGIDPRGGRLLRGPLSWLKKIEPLPENEREPREEEIHA